MSLLALAGSPIQLVPDGTLLFHLVLIVVMVALLNATLLKPINGILAERDKRTKGRLSEAEATLIAVQEKLAEYEHRMRQARAEGYALMERERVLLTAAARERVAKLKAEIAQSLSEQKQRIAREGEQAKAKLTGEARVLALEIGRKILRRPVTG
ncbi:MAG: ATP synthase F0 subunit B [Terriglobia bacterium]